MAAAVDNLKGASDAHADHADRFAGKLRAQLRFYRIEENPGRRPARFADDFPGHDQ
jgi:hypothetical protein